MSKIKRSKRKTPFVQMDKHALQNKKLSWKSKGLLAYLLSLPDDWQIYVTELKEHATDGRDATTNALNELIKNKYISRERTRNDKGYFSGYDYVVFDSPFTDKPETENPFTENPNSDKPISENPTLLILDNTNKQNTNKISIAGKKQIKDLERENQELQKKLEEALNNPKPKKKVKARFVAPTLEIIIPYFIEKESDSNEAEKFYHFYESKGWKVGKGKMEKWKSAASGWIKRNAKPINGKPQPTLLPSTLTTTTKLTTHSAEQVWICFKRVYSTKREKELVGGDFRKTYYESNRIIEKELFEIGKESQLAYNFIPLISELEKTYPELYGKTQKLYDQKQKSKLR